MDVEVVTLANSQTLKDITDKKARFFDYKTWPESGCVGKESRERQKRADGEHGR